MILQSESGITFNFKYVPRLISITKMLDDMNAPLISQTSFSYSGDFPYGLRQLRGNTCNYVA